MMKRVAYKSIDETRLSVQITDQEKRTCCLKYGQNRQSVKGRQKKDRPTDQPTDQHSNRQTEKTILSIVEREKQSTKKMRKKVQTETKQFTNNQVSLVATIQCLLPLFHDFT